MNNETADEIRGRMAQIRSALDGHAHTAVREARRTTDWRSYVRFSPWTFAAAAVVAGYLLIPRRPKVVVNGKDVEQIVKDAVRRSEAESRQVKPTGLALWVGLFAPVLQRAAIQGAAKLWEAFKHSPGTATRTPEEGNGEPRTRRSRQPR